MRKPNSKGFTLIELMVAMAIAMIALLAVGGLYAVTRQTNRVQGMQSRLSEDGRFALSMLERLITQAGFRPKTSTALDTSRVNTVTATSMKIKFAPDGTNQIDCDGAVATGAGSEVTLAFDSGAKTLKCGTTAWLAPAGAGAGRGTEVVDAQFLYGIDTTPKTPADYGCGPTAVDGTKPGDCVADSFTSTPADVTQIVAVKVCLVLRSEGTDLSIVKPANVNNCSGAAIADTQNDNKLYRTFRSTILLRNR